MKRRVQIATVPEVGGVAATIGYVVRADGTEVNHMLAGAVYADTRRPLSNEHLETVRRFLDVG
ncbi:hypothetical protein MK786_05375 [Microbacterium sp. CFH 31415]|uniref:hypothetical protein n=1 Tax=Microbacterium sp. CFH 31415 TaxID=2921732 RepID=UPI001F12AD74|nr:hypothetical protein [Microbacterium sp. CFH 31415]MCH6230164.1 hypothetical protein [Microbacterium sp. CFH 31415]